MNEISGLSLYSKSMFIKYRMLLSPDIYITEWMFAYLLLQYFHYLLFLLFFFLSVPFSIPHLRFLFCSQGGGELCVCTSAEWGGRMEHNTSFENAHRYY